MSECTGACLKDLDVATVEAGDGDEAALAAGPDREVDLGLVGPRLHGEPCDRRVGRGPYACAFNHTPDVLAAFFGKVRHHDRVEDYGRHPGPRVGEMGLEPGDGVRTVDCGGDP